MTRGRIDKRQRQADLLRKKSAQAASTLTQGAKTPPKAIPVAHYPGKRVAIGKRQVPGG
jgi:hypothetical protein